MTRGSWCAFVLVATTTACGGVVGDEGDVSGDTSVRDTSGDVDVVVDGGADADDDAADGVETDSPAETEAEAGADTDADGDAEADADVDGDAAADADDGTGDAGAADTGPRCGDGVRQGSEECDDGNTVPADGCESDCRFSCHLDTECNDGNVCTTDVCATVTGGRRCVHENATGVCDDGNVCTHPDFCEGGICRPGRCTAACTWAADEDGDGYGAAPPPEPACSATRPFAGWVNNATDCCDGQGDVNPGQTSFFVDGYNCDPEADSWDYNCDGRFEQRYVTCARCEGTTPMSCTLGGEGWVPTFGADGAISCTPPACGTGAVWVTSCAWITGPLGVVGCYPVPDPTGVRQQECR